MSLDLYNYLTVYGSVYETTHKLNDTNKFVDWTEENFTYVKYNPRKSVNRYGLSLTSLDGNISGVPDLDSLYEYNKENKIKYTEQDFKTTTLVYKYPEITKILKPIKYDLFRSHIIKLESGGFFPPHRDFRGMNIDSFRIIIPLKNTKPPAFTFIVDGIVQHWNEGSLYFVDTAKMHYLFNASFDPVYMIVLNVNLNQTTVNFVTNHLQHR
jgi:hypothetical protein